MAYTVRTRKKFKGNNFFSHKECNELLEGFHDQALVEVLIYNVIISQSAMSFDKLKNVIFQKELHH